MASGVDPSILSSVRSSTQNRGGRGLTNMDNSELNRLAILDLTAWIVLDGTV